MERKELGNRMDERSEGRKREGRRGGGGGRGASKKGSDGRRRKEGGPVGRIGKLAGWMRRGKKGRE